MLEIVDHNLSLHTWQVGAIIVYTFVFHMLAPPPGGTFEGIENEKLPTTASTNIVVPEKMPLLISKEPEPIELESSRKGKVRRKYSSIYIQHYIHALMCIGIS